MDRPEDRGVYRRIPVRIMGAYHTPPEPVVVPEQMENLIKEFAKKKLHPIENAALFHLKLILKGKQNLYFCFCIRVILLLGINLQNPLEKECIISYNTYNRRLPDGPRAAFVPAASRLCCRSD